jgi:hypothetical protein
VWREQKALSCAASVNSAAPHLRKHSRGESDKAARLYHDFFAPHSEHPHSQRFIQEYCDLVADACAYQMERTMTKVGFPTTVAKAAQYIELADAG